MPNEKQRCYTGAGEYIKQPYVSREEVSVMTSRIEGDVSYNMAEFFNRVHWFDSNL